MCGDSIVGHDVAHQPRMTSNSCARRRWALASVPRLPRPKWRVLASLMHIASAIVATMRVLRQAEGPLEIEADGVR